MKGQTLDL